MDERNRKNEEEEKPHDETSIEGIIEGILEKRGLKASEMSRWQHFFESTGGAALITVLLGGLFGTLLNGQIQEDLKERELRNEMLKAYNAQQLQIYGTFFEEQTKTTEKVVELIGEVIDSGQGALTTLRPEFELLEDKPENGQIIELRERYNSVMGNWNSRRFAHKFLLAYYYSGHEEKEEIESVWRKEEIESVWGKIDTAVSQYFKCVSEQVRQEKYSETACEKDRVNIEELTRTLRKELESIRSKGWTDWERLEGDLTQMNAMLSKLLKVQ